MLRSRRNRTVLAAAAALFAALPVLAACSAGTNPEVYDIKPDNGLATSGYMWISNVWVVADAKTGNAEVIGQVANTDPNTGNTVQLTSVTVNGNPVTVQSSDISKVAPGVSVSGGSVSIPGMDSVQFGQKGQPMLLVGGANLTIGQNAQVVYTFSNGNTATATAQVQPNSGLWAQYNPNGPATATTLPTIAPSGGATATSSTPSGTATSTSGVVLAPSATGGPVISGTPNPSSSL